MDCETFFGILNGRLQNTVDTPSAMGVQQFDPGINSTRNGNSEGRLTRNLSVRLFQRAQGGVESSTARGATGPVQATDRLVPMTAEQSKAIPANTRALRLHNTLHRKGGNGRVNSVTTFAQNLQADSGTDGMTGGNHSIFRNNGAASRVMKITKHSDRPVRNCLILIRSSSAAGNARKAVTKQIERERQGKSA